MADETPKKKAAAKPASKKTSAKAEAKKPAAKKEAAKKPAAKKDAAKKAGAKPASKKQSPAKKTAAKKAPPQPIAPPIVRASAKYVRVAPRKVRLVADQVRGKQIDEARALLRFSTRSAARDVAKLIDSAAANAENNHDLVADDMLISEITVDDGPTLKRYQPRALGRATKIDKRTSHIAVALTPEED